MSRLQLVLGTKNLSSWSLRPWLVLRHFMVDFDEVLLSLDTPEFNAQISCWSPTRQVPVLVDGTLRIWDSLAICEYVNEAYLEARGWPADTSTRAHARSLVCEMHSGFADMRNEMPMKIDLPPSSVQLSESAGRDIARVQEIWDSCLARHGGPWLFGSYSIADAFYAPVALRFITYRTALTTESAAYRDRVANHPDVLAWISQSLAE